MLGHLERAGLAFRLAGMYLPHGEEWEKGGYETLYSYLDYYPFHGHVMPFRQDTAERIVGLVLDEWEQMRRS